MAISKQLMNSCYKFMFVMGVLDVLELIIIITIMGGFGLFGTVYCTAPGFIYVIGACAMCKLTKICF